MKWALEHLQLIIAIAGGVAWWLNQRRLARAAEEAPPGPDATSNDPTLAERTQRIREEIRRKIAERGGHYADQPPTLPLSEPAPMPPVVPDVFVRPAEPPTLSRAAAARLEADRAAESLDQQATYLEQLRLADEMKEVVARRARFESENSSGQDAAVVTRLTLDEDLRDPDRLRRAFVLREVLGPPLALR